MLTVASYNIHRCIGTDSIYRPNRIVRVLQELKADVVGLQEVDAHRMHKEGHQLDFIAKETGYQIVVGSTMWREEADYGNALLSRHPIYRSRKYNLTVPGCEPRGAVEIDIEVAGGPIRILNTHLGLRYSERRRQVRALIEIIESSPPEVPVVLLGDFNEWLPMFGSTLIFRTRFHYTKRLRTFPSTRPLFGLDKVFVDRKKLLLRTEAVRNALTKKASDHLPIKAQLRL